MLTDALIHINNVIQIPCLDIHPTMTSVTNYGLSTFMLFFETGSQVAQAGLEFAMQSGMTLNSCSSHFTNVCHHTCLKLFIATHQLFIMHSKK